MSGQGKLHVEVGGALVQPTLLTSFLPIAKPASYGFFFFYKEGRQPSIFQFAEKSHGELMLELAVLHMCGWSEMGLPGMNLLLFWKHFGSKLDVLELALVGWCNTTD